MSGEVKDKLWGKYEILLEDENCKVKKITVSPKKRLSYQSHQKRAEVWVVTAGEGKVTQEDNITKVGYGGLVVIPQESKHRIENIHETQDLVFIETQIGTYFGEDDIVRFDDDWGRHRDNWANVDDDLE